MPPKNPAKKDGQGKKAGPEIKIIETEENAAAIKNMFNRKAELIYGKDRTFNSIKKSDKPYIVWLYGPPGSGKSSPATKKIISDDLGLNTDNAVNISLDALIESLEPFQRKSANIYRSNKTAEEKVSLAYSLYAQTYQYKINGDKNKTLNYKRRELFKKAVDYELDIIYEFVASGYKDDFKEDIYSVLENAGKLDKYDIYIVYPFVEIDEIKERLAKRPEKQMSSNTPFYRTPTTSSTLIKNIISYFVEYIIPRSKDITGELPVISNYIKYKLEYGMTEEQIKEELAKSKDLTDTIKKVIVFKNKSINNSSSKPIGKRFSKTLNALKPSITGGKTCSNRTIKRKNYK